MTKAEFVDRLAAKSGLTKKDAANVVDAFVDVITDALKEGEDVQFTGFGKFYVQKREAREGINPQTKAKIKIAATKVPEVQRGFRTEERLQIAAPRIRLLGAAASGPFFSRGRCEACQAAVSATPCWMLSSANDLMWRWGSILS